MPKSTISDTQERERKSSSTREAFDHDGTCAACEQDMAAALRVTKEEYEAAGRE